MSCISPDGLFGSSPCKSLQKFNISLSVLAQLTSACPLCLDLLWSLCKVQLSLPVTVSHERSGRQGRRSHHSGGDAVVAWPEEDLDSHLLWQLRSLLVLQFLRFTAALGLPPGALSLTVAPPVTLVEAKPSFLVQKPSPPETSIVTVLRHLAYLGGSHLYLFFPITC